jgi:hypothetical protein
MPKTKLTPKEAPPGGWKSRIVGHAKVCPKKLAANPLNFRTHPLRQREVLKAAIEELGFVRSVTVNKRTGNIVDGHERVLQAADSGQPTIDVEYIDVSEEEERKILATLDPIAELATVDGGKLDELLHDLAFGDVALQQMLLENAEQNSEALLGDVSPSGASENRDLGEKRKQIKPVLYADQVATFETALAKTGIDNRGQALIEICSFYMQHHGEKTTG